MGRVAVMVMVMGFAAACGGGGNQEAAPGAVDIAFTSQPAPPVAGENTFEVTLAEGGQPITDAEVAVTFFMGAMPSMNMPEMRNTVPLAHQGGGRYRGTGDVMMAGNWDVTVTASRGGQQIATEMFDVAAE